MLPRTADEAQGVGGEAAGRRGAGGEGGEGKKGEGAGAGAGGEVMGRESAFPEMYEERQEKILNLLLQLKCHVVCLQEYIFF
jgi:hypothetical protein